MLDYFSLHILSDISSLYFTLQNFLAILHLTTICLNNTMSDSTQRNPSKKYVQKDSGYSPVRNQKLMLTVLPESAVS